MTIKLSRHARLAAAATARREQQRSSTVIAIPVVKTRAVVAGEAMINVVAEVEAVIRSSKVGLDKFAERFAMNPAYAFEWSADTFKVAARYEMAHTVKRYLELVGKQEEYATRSDESILKVIHEELFQEMMRKAKWPEHSTSTTSNLMSLELNAVRAEWVERLAKIIANVEKTS